MDLRVHLNSLPAVVRGHFKVCFIAFKGLFLPFMLLIKDSELYDDLGGIFHVYVLCPSCFYEIDTNVSVTFLSLNSSKSPGTQLYVIVL